jgi:hypothetical protein
MGRDVSTLRGTAVIRFAAAAFMVLVSVVGAAAQSAANRASSDLGDAPVAVDGWRYIWGPNDLHVYLCDHPGCAPGSRVSFLLFPSSSPSPTAVVPGLLRRQRDAVGEMLQERLAPCEVVGGFPLVPAPMHCVATASDGTKSYDTTGIIDGSKLSASLISSSSDEAASEGNYGQFEAALTSFTNSNLRAKP